MVADSLRSLPCCSADPGNYTLGLETMALKTNGSFVWPTVNTETDSAVRQGADRARLCSMLCRFIAMHMGMCCFA